MFFLVCLKNKLWYSNNIVLLINSCNNIICCGVRICLFNKGCVSILFSLNKVVLIILYRVLIKCFI